MELLKKQQRNRGRPFILQSLSSKTYRIRLNAINADSICNLIRERQREKEAPMLAW